MRPPAGALVVESIHHLRSAHPACFAVTPSRAARIARGVKDRRTVRKARASHVVVKKVHPCRRAPDRARHV